MGRREGESGRFWRRGKHYQVNILFEKLYKNTKCDLCVSNLFLHLYALPWVWVLCVLILNLYCISLPPQATHIQWARTYRTLTRFYIKSFQYTMSHSLHNCWSTVFLNIYLTIFPRMSGRKQELMNMFSH